MIERYVLRGETWISKETGKPMKVRAGVSVPQITRDIPAYISPVTHKPVDGRAARREDLKRSGSREVDPSEWKPTYQNKNYAIANNGEHEPRKAVDLGSGYVRGPSR